MDDLTKTILAIVGGCIAICAVVMWFVFLKIPGKLHDVARDKITRQYNVSRHIVVQAVSMSVTTGCLPAIAAAWHRAPTIVMGLFIWLGFVMALATFIAYISVCAYLQHYRLPQQIARREAYAMLSDTAYRTATKSRLFVMDGKAERIRKIAGQSILLRNQCEEKIQTLMRQEMADTSLLSILRSQWQKQYAAATEETIRKRLGFLNSELWAQSTVDTSRQTAIQLESLTIQQELIRRAIAKAGATDYENVFAERLRLTDQIKRLQETISMHRTKRDQQHMLIASYKKQRLVLQ